MALSENRLIRFNRTRALWAPIILLEFYLAFTVFIFFFGPVEWDIPNVPKLLVFLIINYGGLWIGYGLGIRRGKRTIRRSQACDVGIVRFPPQVMGLLLISMIFAIFSYMIRLYAIRGSPEAFLLSFIHPGEAYRESQVLAQMDRDGAVMTIANFSWAFRISTLFGCLSSLYFPLGLICWHRMNIAYRAIFITALLCNLLFTVGLGAQSGMAILLFAALPIVLFKLYVHGKPMAVGASKGMVIIKKKGWNSILVKTLVVVLVCALGATLAFFQLDRAEDSGRELNAAKDLGGQYSSPALHGVIPVTGGRMNYGIVMVCQYVSHGYEGLALSMELPFEWTYGLGWSKALQVIYHDYLGGADVFQKSYLARNELQSGWPALAWWSTIFPWIASDTTYHGTIFVMLFIGYVIGRCWTGVIVSGNPLGFAVLAHLFNLVFMFPANNALAQSLDGLFSLMGLLVLYAVSLKYFKAKRTALLVRAVGD